jgi:hypothetical protein
MYCITSTVLQKGVVFPHYVAVYNYTAADDDEISFQEGTKLALFLS